MSFKIENEKQNRIPFLDVQIIRIDKTFIIFVYHKPIFSEVYTDFVSFLTSTCKFVTVYTLAYITVYTLAEYAQFRLNYTLN